MYSDIFKNFIQKQVSTKLNQQTFCVYSDKVHTYIGRFNIVSVRTRKWEGSPHPSRKNSKYHPALSATQPSALRQGSGGCGDTVNLISSATYC